ncbi:MAG: hypothetical protein AAF206_21545 [Bacteroidota bacterium]
MNGFSQKALLQFVMLFLMIGVGCEVPMVSGRSVPQPDILYRQISQGKLPTPGPLQSGRAHPDIRITHAQSSASIAAGQLLSIPFYFISASPLRHALLQIKGSQHTWSSEVVLHEWQQASIQLWIPNGVPASEFQLQYRLVNLSGQKSEIRTLDIRILDIVRTQGSRPIRISGKDGIGIWSVDLGRQAGEVLLEYDMFLMKDRIDVRYADNWVGSSASGPRAYVPAVPRCEEAKEADGFISQRGYVSFKYDPSISRTVDIYISACIDGGTLWQVDIIPPQVQEPEGLFPWLEQLGNRTVRFIKNIASIS